MTWMSRAIHPRFILMKGLTLARSLFVRYFGSWHRSRAYFPKPHRSENDTTSRFPHSDRMMPFAKIVLVAIIYSGKPKAGHPFENSLINCRSRNGQA